LNLQYLMWIPDSVSLNGSSDPLITHTEAGKLLNALLKLRQACCHPQVGSSGLRSLQQSPMTMEEILMVCYLEGFLNFFFLHTIYICLSIVMELNL